ncbi:MAG: hypothetical protein ABJH04_07935 [Cyclobacteriaceae bacterium]
MKTLRKYAIGIILIVLVGCSGNGPESTYDQILKAKETHDFALLSESVDVDAVVGGLSEGRALPAMLVSLAKESAQKEIKDYIEKGELNANGGVLDLIAYSDYVGADLNDVTLTKLSQEGKKSVFDLSVYLERYNKSITRQVSIIETNGKWRLTQVEDLASVGQWFIDAENELIDSLNKPITKLVKLKNWDYTQTDQKFIAEIQVSQPCKSINLGIDLTDNDQFGNSRSKIESLTKKSDTVWEVVVQTKFGKYMTKDYFKLDGAIKVWAKSAIGEDGNEIFRHSSWEGLGNIDE